MLDAGGLDQSGEGFSLLREAELCCALQNDCRLGSWSLPEPLCPGMLPRFDLLALLVALTRAIPMPLQPQSSGLKVGLFGIGLDVYWLQFAGLEKRLQGYIEPVSVFPLAITVTMIVMALFGGKGTVFGPVLGAVVLFVAQEIVWASYPYFHPLLFGAIIVAVVLLMPRGVLGLLQQRYRLPRTI